MGKVDSDWFKLVDPVLSDTSTGLKYVGCCTYNTLFFSENFGENDDEETPNWEEYSQAVKSQIDEEYATEAPSSGFDEGEVEKCNLPGLKKQKIHRSNSKCSK